MTYSYFLGANSENGFASLYNEFPGRKSALHIIKGGPGGGKSGFMRRIGSAAEKHGLDVEYILCSGDPDSLDGVRIPALGYAWVDGTAPHIIEPEVFGAVSDYVNLGRFCSTPLSPADSERAARLNREYKDIYTRAYNYLAAAGAIDRALDIPASANELQSDIKALLEKHLPSRTAQGSLTKRFISAHSCLGRVLLEDTVSKLCKLIFRVHAPSAVLNRIADEAVLRGADVILCPSPLRPSETEAVLVPAFSLAFVSAKLEFSFGELLGAPASGSAEPEAAAQLYGRALSLAYDSLREAKALHDELERVYRPYMDFAALDEYTENVINALF